MRSIARSSDRRPTDARRRRAARSRGRQRDAGVAAPRRARSSSACGATAIARCSAYARRFDGSMAPIEVTRARDRASARATVATRRAARDRGRPRGTSGASPRKQVPAALDDAARCRASRSSSASLPLDRVGCYVPGGRYPLPSSLLMTAIPGARRRRAGGDRRVPAARSDGHVRGARGRRRSRCSGIGGAHAIAALAYGTATIPRVDKIVGPGNAYVAAAKALVAARLRHRFLRRPERDRGRLDDRHARRGSPPI